MVEAITTNGHSPSSKTPPPFRPSSLLSPPDPPMKQIPNQEASKVAKNLTDQLQTITRPPANPWKYMEHKGYTYDAIKKCLSEITDSKNSLPQTPHQSTPFSRQHPPDPPPKVSPQPMASQVARNLTPLFQPTPRKSQLLQMTHPALRSLPDEIQYEIRKKIKKEEDRVQKSPQWKIVTERKNFLEAVQHKCIVTEALGYRFDPNQKCFRTIENWYTDW